MSLLPLCFIEPLSIATDEDSLMLYYEAKMLLRMYKITQNICTICKLNCVFGFGHEEGDEKGHEEASRGVKEHRPAQLDPQD